MVTIKEIARLAGVTPKTAERALSGTTLGVRRDARERAERVREIAARLGYQPSELALSLRRGSTRTIGLLVDHLTDQFLSAAAEVAMDEANRAGYRLALRLAKFDPERTAAELQGFLASGVDAIFTTCAVDQLPQDLCANLRERRFPLLTLCGMLPDGCSSVTMDYSDAVPAAVRAVAARGHRRIMLALFGGKPVENDRTAAVFRAACEGCGAMPDVRVNHSLHDVADLADTSTGPVLLFGKYSTRVFLDHCREQGRRPEVVGFYNEWTWAAARKFSFCGVIWENAEMAVRESVKQLVREIGGAPPQALQIAARFIPEPELGAISVIDPSNQYLFRRD